MGDVFESKVSEEEYQKQLNDTESALTYCEQNLRDAREVLVKIKYSGSQFMINKYIDKYFKEYGEPE